MRLLASQRSAGTEILNGLLLDRSSSGSSKSEWHSCKEITRMHIHAAEQYDREEACIHARTCIPSCLYISPRSSSVLAFCFDCLAGTLYLVNSITLANSRYLTGRLPYVKYQLLVSMERLPPVPPCWCALCKKQNPTAIRWDTKPKAAYAPMGI